MTDTDAATDAYEYPLLIKQLLHTPLAIAPNQELVYADHRRYDYRTFKQRLASLAAGLTTLGVAKGSTVAVMDWDSHRYLECFFAVPMMGAVLHTINVRLAPEQILYTVNHAEDDFILVHADFLPLLLEIRERIERPVKVILLRDNDDTPETTLNIENEYEQLVSGAAAQFEFPEFDERTRATTFYTTGTTGNPKGVYYSHRQLVLHTMGVMGSLGAASHQGRLHMGDVYMPITPMFHVHAWGFPYVATLMGLKQVYPGRYTPEALLQLIQRERVTFSHCVPTILHMLLNSPLIDEFDLSNWKVVIGGSALPQGLAQAAIDRGIDVFSAYGMSETCPFVSVAHLSPAHITHSAEEQLSIRCKTGRAAPMVELRVVDDNMNDVNHNGKDTGEVVVRAPWLTQGYRKNPEGSEQLWMGSYLHTGDIGHIDASGYLQITDRLKDVIKSGGEWISSLRLEDIASQHPGVVEVAAIGIPDERWGERPMLLVVRGVAGMPDIGEDDIRDHVRQYADRGEISTWAVPDRVEFVSAIAKTSVGKLDKKRLRQLYGGPR
ncbi:MAG: fatty acid--CoA ligase [Gammaproteobacteria bacterium]|nr:fatty acid--CoA ligase [Gammaproteobacteria bacterium]MDH3468109.1 fatty acid--CoA ligase [Gammaproteobacteria bacterium]